jgi:hypothetical protein
MRKQTGIILAGALLAAAAGAPALAHHSYAMFDAQQNKQLDGTVQAFKWTNPHSYIEVMVMDDKGQAQTWGVECGSPAQMVRAGWKSTSLKAGDHVVVTVHPLRDGTAGGSFVQVQTADGKVLKGS